MPLGRNLVSLLSYIPRVSGMMFTSTGSWGLCKYSSKSSCHEDQIRSCCHSFCVKLSRHDLHLIIIALHITSLLSNYLALAHDLRQEVLLSFKKLGAWNQVLLLEMRHNTEWSCYINVLVFTIRARHIETELSLLWNQYNHHLHEKRQQRAWVNIITDVIMKIHLPSL